MEAVRHPIGSRVRVTEKRDPNDGRVGTVIERGDWTAAIRYRTLVRFAEGMSPTRWYADDDLVEVSDEGE